MAALAGGLAHAQTYPAKLVRVVTPSPGGDPLMRVIQPKLAEFLGQAVIIDSKFMGADGVLIAGEVAKAGLRTARIGQAD